MKEKFFSDKTIKGHIAKYGKDNYIKQIQEKLRIGEEKYTTGKKKLEYILERVKDLS